MLDCGPRRVAPWFPGRLPASIFRGQAEVCVSRYVLRSPLTARCLLVGCVWVAGCDKDGGSASTTKRPRVAYVTNGIDPFWDTAIAGARVGAKEFNLDVEPHKPA